MYREQRGRHVDDDRHVIELRCWVARRYHELGWRTYATEGNTFKTIDRSINSAPHKAQGESRSCSVPWTVSLSQ